MGDYGGLSQVSSPQWDMHRTALCSNRLESGNIQSHLHKSSDWSCGSRRVFQEKEKKRAKYRTKGNAKFEGKDQEETWDQSKVLMRTK